MSDAPQEGWVALAQARSTRLFEKRPHRYGITISVLAARFDVQCGPIGRSAWMGRSTRKRKFGGDKADPEPSRESILADLL